MGRCPGFSVKSSGNQFPQTWLEPALVMMALFQFCIASMSAENSGLRFRDITAQEATSDHSRQRAGNLLNQAGLKLGGENVILECVGNKRKHLAGFRQEIGDQSQLLQYCPNFFNAFFCGFSGRVDRHFGRCRRLVWVRNACEVLNFSL